MWLSEHLEPFLETHPLPFRLVHCGIYFYSGCLKFNVRYRDVANWMFGRSIQRTPILKAHATGLITFLAVLTAVFEAALPIALLYFNKKICDARNDLKTFRCEGESKHEFAVKCWCDTPSNGGSTANE